MWLSLANLPEWPAMIADHSDVLTGDARAGAVGLAVSTVVFCVARGVRVIIGGHGFFREDLKTS